MSVDEFHSDVEASERSIIYFGLSALTLGKDGRLIQTYSDLSLGDRELAWFQDFPAELAGHAALRFKPGIALYQSNFRALNDTGALPRNIFLLDNDGELVQIWDDTIWRLDYPARLAGLPDLRFSGRPAVSSIQQTPYSKRVFAITSDGRLAQLYDFDRADVDAPGRWRCDFPVESTQCSDLRFSYVAATTNYVHYTQRRWPWHSYFAITVDGRLMHFWDTDVWNINFPAELLGRNDIRFSSIDYKVAHFNKANERHLDAAAVTVDHQLVHLFHDARNGWNIHFPMATAGQPDLRVRGKVVISYQNPRIDSENQRPQICCVTTDGRLAHIAYDYVNAQLTFPVEIAGDPDLRFAGAVARPPGRASDCILAVTKEGSLCHLLNGELDYPARRAR